MIRSPLGLRINPLLQQNPRDQILEAARVGAKGVVLDASGDLAPERLSETGRRDLRQMLRSTELSLIALNLPTRRPFDTDDELDARVARADRAFALAYHLGARVVLGRVGAVPAAADPRREIFTRAVEQLGRRAERQGVRLAIETGAEAGSVLRAFLDETACPGLAASIDSATLLRMSHSPIAATRELGPWVAHAYAADALGSTARPGPASAPGYGMPPGALDWAEYLGALEEIDYRGFLTVWPDPAHDVGPQFARIAALLSRF